MADIEDRVLKHSHAFEGLLSLVPVTEKRKLTKEEKREEAKKAKKAKLNHETKAGKTPKEPIETTTKIETPAIIEAPTNAEEFKPKGKKQKKQHQTAELEKKDGPDKKTEKEEKVEKPKKKEKQKPVPKLPLQEKKKPTTPKPPPQDTQLPSPSPSSTEPIDPPTTTTTPEAETTKPEITPAARAEARARLAAHINSLRARRNPTTSTTPTRTRAALLEAREKKEASRKERKKALRLAQKLESESADNTPPVPASLLVRPPPMTEKEMEKAANNFTFGTIQFDDGQELDHTLGDFKKSRKRKGPTDVMGQIKQVEAKKARLETMDPEKRGKIYEKEMWSKALKQTVGEKVRDDEKLLKKAFKRQEVQKKKSEREWKERKESVAKGIAIRQKKREENINARKEQKKLGKAGMKKKVKASKAGGKKKAPQHSKNKGGKSGRGDKPGKSTSKTAGGGGKRFGK